MKNKICIKFIIVLFFFLGTFFFYSQTDSNEKDYYSWFDSAIGDGNIGLYNGIDYKEKYRTLKGNHKYYNSPKFQIGNVVYDKQQYYNIEMKYDIYDDQLIVKLPSQSGSNFIQLIKEKLSVFSIEAHQFIKISISKSENLPSNNFVFFEELYVSNELILYKDYNKIRNRRFLKKGFHYNIFKDRNEYYLHYKNKYFLVKSKNSILNLFPNLAKEVSTFYKRNKKLLGSNIDMFYVNLIKKLSDLLSNERTRK
ncbi:MAG: hypothetical protein L3J20_12265 [Flavobacteriaceae bacterium]|nr:hypothetical protein [Flavobacteriaceae bacterium]